MFLAGFYELFGVSTFVSRLPFALFGLGTVCVAVFICQVALARDPNTGYCGVIAGDIGSVPSFMQAVPVLQYDDVLYFAFIVRICFAAGEEKIRFFIAICRGDTAVSQSAYLCNYLLPGGFSARCYFPSRPA